MPFNVVSLDGVEAQKLKVGTKTVIRKVAEKIKETTPNYYNDGLGGTNVKRTTEDMVYDYLGRFIGKRTINEEYLTKVNDNGKIYTPKKPFIISKVVEKEAIKENGEKIESRTEFRFNSGTKERRTRTGMVRYEYFNDNGLSIK